MGSHDPVWLLLSLRFPRAVSYYELPRFFFYSVPSSTLFRLPLPIVALDDVFLSYPAGRNLTWLCNQYLGHVDISTEVKEPVSAWCCFCCQSLLSLPSCRWEPLSVAWLWDCNRTCWTLWRIESMYSDWIIWVCFVSISHDTYPTSTLKELRSIFFLLSL